MLGGDALGFGAEQLGDLWGEQVGKFRVALMLLEQPGSHRLASVSVRHGRLQYENPARLGRRGI